MQYNSYKLVLFLKKSLNFFLHFKLPLIVFWAYIQSHALLSSFDFLSMYFCKFLYYLTLYLNTTSFWSYTTSLFILYGKFLNPISQNFWSRTSSFFYPTWHVLTMISLSFLGVCTKLTFYILKLFEKEYLTPS